MKWLRGRWLGLGSSRRSEGDRKRDWTRYRPWFEMLEERTVPSTTVVVTSTADSGTGTLRSALATAGVTTIDFNFSGSGVHTIELLSPLAVNTNVLIDGYSQPGSSMNTSTTGDNAHLLVRIDGAQAGAGATGMNVTANGCTIRGIIFTGFRGNTSTNPATGGIAINVSGSGNLITGNFIGLASDGNTGNGNARGIELTGPSNTVGTTSSADTADRNLVSGNFLAGVDITGTLATGNLISGNLIGPNNSGSAAPIASVTGNGIVIENGARQNQIGIGSFPGLANTIAYNGAAGVVVGFPNSTTDPKDDGTIGNTIRQNSIHDNHDMGIDLNAPLAVISSTNPASFYGDGITLNDWQDTDRGPNNLQNYPIIVSANPGPTTTITGTLSSTPSTTYTLDFYASAAPDAQLFGEGQQYLGSTMVTTDATGNATFSVSLAITTNNGQWVTATATDPNGNTSEFSQAQQLPYGPPALSSTSWTSVGPLTTAKGRDPGGLPTTGRITTLAADPTNANVIYVGGADGGVWKTTNGGQSWAPLTDNQITLAMGAIAIAPSNTSIIYAGTGEADDLESLYGMGILKSTDGGTTWTLSQGNPGKAEFNLQHISQIVVNPTNPNLVYVAVEGPENTGGPVGFAGIWVSANGGLNWKNTTTSISVNAEYTDLVMDPVNPNILFAAVGTIHGNAANGLYVTTNGGQTWAPAGNFPTGTQDGKIKLAIAKTNDQIMYAAVAQPVSGMLYEFLKSSDGGQTWTQLTNIPNYFAHQGFFDNTIAVSPTDPTTVFAGGSYNNNNPGIIEITGGGTSWTSINTGADGNGPHTDHHGIGFDASGRLLVGTDGGIWRLDNPTPGSVHWTDINANLAITQMNGNLAILPSNPGIMYGGTLDNGLMGTNSSVVWNGLYTYGNGYGAAVDPNNPQNIYFVQGDTSIVIYRSTDGGEFWSQAVNGITQSSVAAYYEPLVMDPNNSQRLLFGSNYIWQTVDGANTWTAFAAPNVHGFNPKDASVDSLTIAPTNSNTVYATAGGHNFVTANGGGTWTTIDVPGVTDHFACIYVNPANSMNVFLTRDQFTTGGATGRHVFESTNGGAAWSDISGNLPNLPTNTIVLDPATGALYVGNDTGVFVSTNNGGTWTQMSSGLPNSQVVDLKIISGGILAAATHGRGVFEILLPGGTVHGGAPPAATGTLRGFLGVPPSDAAALLARADGPAGLSSGTGANAGSALSSVVATPGIAASGGADARSSARAVGVDAVLSTALWGFGSSRSDEAALFTDVMGSGTNLFDAGAALDRLFAELALAAS